METFDFLRAPSLDCLLNMPRGRWSGAKEGARDGRDVEDKRRTTSRLNDSSRASGVPSLRICFFSTSPEDTEASTDLAGES